MNIPSYLTFYGLISLPPLFCAFFYPFLCSDLALRLTIAVVLNMSGVLLKFARERFSWSGRNKDRRKEEMGKRRKERRDGEREGGREGGWERGKGTKGRVEEGKDRAKGTEVERKKGKQGKEQGKWKEIKEAFLHLLFVWMHWTLPAFNFHKNMVENKFY